MRLDRRLELRTSTEDLSRWQTAARGQGYRGVADWIRNALNRDAARLPGAAFTEAAQVKRPAFGKTTLENGVRIVTESIPGAGSIAAGVFVDCGWRDEAPQQAGLAQLCQRMLFQGTSSRDAAQIAREIDSAGGSLSGLTRRDYTCVFAVVPSDRRFQAMDLLGDIFLNSTFPAGHLEREKHRIAQQEAGIPDQPAFHCSGRMKSEAWGGLPLLRPAGSAPMVLGHTREDAIYFIENHYSPNRMIVAAAGDLEHAEFVAQARDSFWRMIGESDSAPLVRLAFQEGVSILTVPSTQSYFSLGFEAPDYAHSGRAVIEILTGIIGGGVSSRLFRAVNGTPGLVCGIDACYEPSREAGMLIVEGWTQPSSLHAAVRTVMDSISALGSWRDPVSVEELDLAKARLRARNQLVALDPHICMTRIAAQELYFGRGLSQDQHQSDIESVDLNSVRRMVLGEWQFALRRPRLAVSGPEMSPGDEVRLRRAVRTEKDMEARFFEFEAQIA